MTERSITNSPAGMLCAVGVALAVFALTACSDSSNPPAHAAPAVEVDPTIRPGQPTANGKSFDSLCRLITQEDATKLLDMPVKKEAPELYGCRWADVNSCCDARLELGVATPGEGTGIARSIFEGARAQTAKERTIQDEPGLGGPAYSDAIAGTSGSRESLQFVCLRSSDVIVSLALDVDRAAGRRTQMREVMRKLCNARLTH